MSRGTSSGARMDLRKVQLTGGSSITVTLPKAWVDRVKIKPGDVVGFYDQPDGSLAIHAHAREERAPQKYLIEIEEGDKDFVFRKIVAAYLMGYDAIVLSSKKPIVSAARLAIRDAVRRIIGLEIVDEAPSSITVQDFLDPREFHMEKAVRRMGMLAQAMQDEALAALREPDPDARRSLEDRDGEVDRLYWLVSKQYHAMLRDPAYASKMELTASEALNFLLVARLIERTADHAERVAQEALIVPAGKVPEAFRVRLEKEGRKAADMFRAALAAFMKKDARAANAIIEDAKAFLRGQEKLLREATALGSEPVSHLAFIIESIGRTAAYAADVSEVAINHKFTSVVG